MEGTVVVVVVEGIADTVVDKDRTVVAVVEIVVVQTDTAGDIVVVGQGWRTRFHFDFEALDFLI